MPFPSGEQYPSDDLYPGGGYALVYPNSLLELPRTFKRWRNGAWELTVTSYDPIEIGSAGEAESLRVFRAPDGGLAFPSTLLGDGVLGDGTLGAPSL